MTEEAAEEWAEEEENDYQPPAPTLTPTLALTKPFANCEVGLIDESHFTTYPLSS